MLYFNPIDWNGQDIGCTDLSRSIKSHCVLSICAKCYALNKDIGDIDILGKLLRIRSPCILPIPIKWFYISPSIGSCYASIPVICVHTLKRYWLYGYDKKHKKPLYMSNPDWVTLIQSHVSQRILLKKMRSLCITRHNLILIQSSVSCNIHKKYLNIFSRTYTFISVVITLQDFNAFQCTVDTLFFVAK